MRMRARRSDGVLFHAGKAALAACTAASMSASLQNGTRRTTSPVAGLVTSPERVLDAACLRPFTHSGTFSMVFRSVGLFICHFLFVSNRACERCCLRAQAD